MESRRQRHRAVCELFLRQTLSTAAAAAALLLLLRTEIDVVVTQEQRRVTGAGRLGAAMEPQPFVVGIIEQDGARCQCAALQTV